MLVTPNIIVGYDKINFCSISCYNFIIFIVNDRSKQKSILNVMTYWEWNLRIKEEVALHWPTGNIALLGYGYYFCIIGRTCN